MKWTIPFVAGLLLLHGCTAPVSDQKMEVASLGEVNTPKDFNAYWYAGEAELNRFSLEQARYGEVHEGHAVMVFVTEPFLKTRQVKSDRGNDPDAVPVLKLNYIRRFTTGIYDYSLMNSSFTPVERNKYPHTLKVSSTAQDWCGQSISQLNWQDGGYRFQGLSYFESEGDVNLDLPEVWLEDELLSVIRLDPKLLPQGKVDMLPGLFYMRMRHTPITPVSAVASLETAAKPSDLPGEDLQVYTVKYPSRTLKIYFEGAFPFRIAGWEETYTSGFGPGAGTLTTKAVRTHQLRSAYWNRNNLKDAPLRKQLGLPSL